MSQKEPDQTRIAHDLNIAYFKSILEDKERVSVDSEVSIPSSPHYQSEFLSTIRYYTNQICILELDYFLRNVQFYLLNGFLIMLYIIIKCHLNRHMFYCYLAGKSGTG